MVVCVERRKGIQRGKLWGWGECNVQCNVFAVAGLRTFSPAFRLAAAARPLTNQLSLPICRVQFPSPSSSPEPVVLRRQRLFYGPLEAERGDSCRNRCDPMSAQGPCWDPVPPLSGSEGVCLCAWVSLGDMMTVTHFWHTQSPAPSAPDAGRVWCVRRQD